MSTRSLIKLLAPPVVSLLAFACQSDVSDSPGSESHGSSAEWTDVTGTTGSPGTLDTSVATEETGGATSSGSVGTGDTESGIEGDDETRLFVATVGDALHVVRVRASGEVSPFGPALTEISPPVTSVFRMMQGANGTRVLIQGGPVDRTLALHTRGWQDLCPSIGATKCSASHANIELTQFLLGRYFEEPLGEGAAVVTYAGETRTDADIIHDIYYSPTGWVTYRTPAGLYLLQEDDTILPIELLPGELPSRAFNTHLLTFSNDYAHLWFLDPLTNARTEIFCPDGEVPIDVITGHPYERCADGIFTATDGAFVDTTNALADALSSAVPLHVEAGRYTFATLADEATRTGRVSVLDPSGAPIVEEVRQYDEVDGWFSYPRVRVHAFAVTPDRVAAYVSFTLLGLDEVDVELHDEHGILVWREGQPALWRKLDQWPTSDVAESPVWAPETAEKIYWVTTDGRLLSFDYETLELGDNSGQYAFAPRING